MSDYDRFANARSGAGLARSGAGAIDQGLRAYMIGVYNYMTFGLGLTGVVAYGAYKFGAIESAGGHIVGLTPFGQAIYVSPLRWVVIFAPLALVFAISAGRNSMSVSATRSVFLAFAALIGLSFSTLFVVFTQASIARAFFETAAAFGALSLYGYTTRRSLSAMGSFMVMGLFGLIIASVVNIFLQSSGLQWALSIVGIGVFAGLTAWDTQAIKESYFAGEAYEASEKKSIYGALRLYLDFINMFQMLLMLAGNRRS
ncbi:MAG: Bax inhibitor-1/YccA family protein [Roseiarcus sp.]|jgi:FtsH-binding integral membrane protein